MIHRSIQADVIVMLDSSDNFSNEDFDQMKEGLAGLVDETFDLSPDVVRVGFVVYTYVLSQYYYI